MEGWQRHLHGALLRRFRRGAGLSQEALAERACISVETVGALERGARRAPYRVTVAALAAALGLAREEHEQLCTAARRPRGRRSESAHNLPWDVGELVGRDQLIADIGDLVATYRLVTLVGSGGAGKTSIAVRVAHEVLPAWTDGAWIVELAAAADERIALELSAAALGVQLARAADPLHALVTRLSDHRLLLVFDGCERIVGCVAAFAKAILRGCPNVHILTTSRERLGIGGERTYRIPPLAPHEAEALFVERAREADPRFTLTVENETLVADVCRRLDGLPLAIELAAARMKAINLTSLARRLDDRFQILGDGSRVADPHHRTMRALLDWSFALLSAGERVLLSRMAIFAGACTLESVESVCGAQPLEATDVLTLLSSLVEKSVVLGEHAGDAMEYRLLESTRCYALEKLHASGEFEALARRHAQWVAGCRAS